MSANEHMLPKTLYTGVSDMDHQHEALFSSINDIKQAFMAPEADRAVGLAALERLHADMAAHFGWEEAAAAAHSIPFEPHAREHARLLVLMTDQIAALQRGSGNIPALLVFLDRCFEVHVAQFDQKFGRELAGQSAVG